MKQNTEIGKYLTKGFVMDDERLKNPDGRPDYFDEMLERIRDIRASEKRFYQKVRDLFALSSDYDKTDMATQVFFATVQNLLIFAVTRKTAAELITARANPADPHFGLLAWKGDKVRKADIVVAKNYLTEDEIDTNQKKLGSTLWGIADQLRGAMDADDFRDYMLSFLFLRYLSDNYGFDWKFIDWNFHHFTGISPGIHHAATRACERRTAMKENTNKDKIVIPVQIERLKLWTRRALETATWLISLGLLAASAAVTGIAVLVWMVSGSEVILALGLGSGLLLGLAGVWHMLCRLDRTIDNLKREPSSAA